MKGVVNMENWKSVRGYEGLYEVSDMGRVRRGDRVLKPYQRKRDGYMEVTLSKNNVPANIKVHQLVARAFIPNPDNLPEVNHKDENKQNNTASNLEWCRHRVNCNHGSRNQRISQGNSRRVEQMSGGVVIKEWSQS